MVYHLDDSLSERRYRKMTNNGNSIDISRTINRQQDENRQHDQQDKEYNPEGDYYYNYYPARARARVRERAASNGRFEAPKMEDLREDGKQLPPREIMEEIAKAYRANINTMISKAAAGIIEKALTAGMEPATVILAIEETGMASRPSPYYLSAVLRNWAQNGVVVSRARDIGVKTTEARPWWIGGDHV
jgi:hypothetical protein